MLPPMIASGRVTNTRSVATTHVARYLRISSNRRHWRLQGRAAARAWVATTPASDGISNATPRKRSAARDRSRRITAMPAPSQTSAGARTRWRRLIALGNATRGDGGSGDKSFATFHGGARQRNPRKGLCESAHSASAGPTSDGDATQRTRKIRQQTDPPPPQGQPAARGQARGLRRLHEHGPRGHGGDEGRAGAADRDRRPPRGHRRPDPPSPGTRASLPQIPYPYASLLRPMQAVIVAGGLGTRLRPLTFNRPKALVPLLNRPQILHILDRLPKSVDEVFVAVNYL